MKSNNLDEENLKILNLKLNLIYIHLIKKNQITM